VDIESTDKMKAGSPTNLLLNCEAYSVQEQRATRQNIGSELPPFVAS